ncbi:MAG TPA: PQQ-binding-like beta-propeller repeat protein, partial [Gemmataceae bacterium]|nr:PQQ-binding-like beta-propeller repeat protein [Gemmataceae bacterium]
MLITAVCPACETRYKLQDSLCGKPIHCPNPQCRRVFTVVAQDSPPPSPPPPPRPPGPGNGPRSGSVVDLVPVLPAETEAAPPRPSAGKSAPSWKAPPPVRRPPGADAPSAATPAAPAVKGPPRELGPGAWAPPPVRRGVAASADTIKAPAGALPPPPSDAGDEAKTEESAPEEPADHRPPRKRTGLIVGAFVGFILVVLAGGGVIAWMLMSRSEGGMAAEAEQAYKQGKFGQAADMYKQLGQQYSGSEKAADYRFMQTLSDFRAQARAPDADVNAVLDHLTAFLHDNKKEALKDRAPDLAESLGWLADSFAAHNAAPQDDGPLAVVGRIQQAEDQLSAVNSAALSADLQSHIDADLSAVRQGVVHAQQVRASIAKLDAAAKGRTPSENVRNFREQLRKEKHNLPDVDQQEAVRVVRDRVYADHMGAVQYNERGIDLPKAIEERNDTRFVVDPRLDGAPGAAPADDPVVLAASRGILYALARTNGKIKWAVRVGVDSTSLPVRVPEANGLPERILVTSADDKAVDCLDADGNRLWRYRMDAECIGRPLVVGDHAYLASYDGAVHEIELFRGKLLGVYPLGQPLTVGGVRDPQTGLLYFAADAFCVYEIDPEHHKCTHVHYTDHPAGSLRGEPLIVTACDDAGVDADWLILSEARGLGRTGLQAYRLPFGDDRDAPAAPMKAPPAPPPAPPEISGWTWFPPLQNGEQLAMVGDTGILGLFNIRQERNLNDPLLFPALLGDVDLAADAARKDRGRAEVVSVQGQDFWVLAGGKLQRLFLELNAAAGPRMTPASRWKALDLGSPLHASQAEPDPVNGGTMLVLATRPLRQINLATAVNDQTGRVVWQRQLGLVCRSDPLELRRFGGWQVRRQLLVLDQGGGLFAFDPARNADLKDEWRDAGQQLFDGLDD